MSGSDNSGGLMSSAGLVRYFDAEDRNVFAFTPQTVIGFGVTLGVCVILANLLV